MSKNVKISILGTFALLSLSLVGCEYPENVWQDVSVRILTAETGAPVANTLVIYQPETGPQFVAMPHLTIDEPSSEFDVTSGVTDDAGLVTLTVYGTTVFCPPSSCPAPPDEVSGKSYIFRVDLEGGNELMTLPISPGSSADSETVRLTILSVGQPEYRHEP